MRFINREENRVAGIEERLSALQRMQGTSGRVIVTGQNVAVAASRVDTFDVAYSSAGTGGDTVVATKRLRNPFSAVATCLIEDVSGPSLGFDPPRGDSCDDDLLVQVGTGAGVYLYGGGAPETWSSGREAKSMTVQVPARDVLTLSLIDTVAVGFYCNFRITWSIS